MRIGLICFALLAITLVGLGRSGSLFPDFNEKNVVLSNKPIMLGVKPVRLSTKEGLKVLGVTTDLCVTLSDDAPDVHDVDKEYAKLKGGAHLLAVLHAHDGKDYTWKCGGWAFTPNGAGRGRMDSCMNWECSQSPPKGTEIASIDLSSDRPLRILSAHWSSTDNFDFVSQPPPDTVAVPSAEYRELEHAFGGQSPWKMTARRALQVTLTSNRRRASLSTFNSTLSLRMTAAGIQLQPGSSAVGMGTVTIPTSAIESCSMSCFSNLARETDLLLPRLGIRLGVLNAPELNDWCWRQHIPMATSASSRAWLYKGTPLPPKNSYTAQFGSRTAYDDQAHRSCMGY